MWAESGPSGRVQSGYDRTELGHAESERRKEEEGGGPGEVAERAKAPKELVTKMTGLYREKSLCGEGQPRPTPGVWGWVGDRVCQPHPVTGRGCGMLGEHGSSAI